MVFTAMFWELIVETAHSVPSDSLEIVIDNLKCGGCANTIVKGVSALDGVRGVEVLHDTSTVRVQATGAQRPAIEAKLTQMGYPPAGSLAGIQAGLANAKSYVSCAIGRIS
jgi:copper chaperone